MALQVLLTVPHCLVGNNLEQDMRMETSFACQAEDFHPGIVRRHV